MINPTKGGAWTHNHGVTRKALNFYFVNDTLLILLRQK